MAVLQDGIDLDESFLGGVFLPDGVGVLSRGSELVGKGRSDELLHFLVDGCSVLGSEGKGVCRGRSSINRIGSVTGRG